MKNSISKTLIGTAVVKALAIALLFFATAHNAHAQNSQYIYCLLSDNMNSTVYFSNVFPGDYSQEIGYSVAFTNFVHGHFSNVIGVANCFLGDNPSAARSEEDGIRSTDRRIYKQIVETQWSY